MQIYATGTMRANMIGLPLTLTDTRAFRNALQGTLDWRMHESRGLACVLWKDKKPVLLLSTYAIPIGYPCMHVPIVPRRNGVERENIMTSPMHLEYTTHMQGVDVADQLRASYSTQNRTHKWWHRIFFFLLDTTVVNMYMIYLVECKRRSKPLVTHLQFRVELCEALLQQWRSLRAPKPPRRRGYYYPVFTELWKPCVVCNGPGMSPVVRPGTYCSWCDNKYMCFRKGCYKEYHECLH
jgi:hypothetical protein